MKKQTVLLSLILLLSGSCWVYSNQERSNYPSSQQKQQYKQPSHQETPVAIRPYGSIGYNLRDSDQDYDTYSYGVQFLIMSSSYAILGPAFGYLNVSTLDSNRIINSEFFYFNFVTELHFIKPFIFQFGYGIYFPIGDNDTTEFGLMSAIGLDIPISKNFAFPIILRFDFLDKNIIPLTISSGITIKV